MKKFIANAYEVEIWEDDICHLLKINDATGTFKSIKLDEISDQTVKAIGVYNSILPDVQDIISKEIKLSDMTEAQKKSLDTFEKVSRKLKVLNAEYVKLNVKDWEKNVDLIDSVNSDHREHLFGAIKRASLGITDNRESSKKKVPLAKFNGGLKSTGSAKKATRKKRSTRGTSTESIGDTG